LPDRRSTDSIKWHQHGDDVLPMWLADMDFLSPAPVVEALRKRVEHGVFGYPEGIMGSMGVQDDIPAFRRLIVDRLAERYDWHVLPEELVFIPGVVVASNLACHAFVAPNGGVLAQTPVYPPILHAAEWTGRKLLTTQLARQADGSYAVDWQQFESAITPETQMFILCNPHNPVGRVFDRAELERMAEICLKRNVVICSDEIHCDLIFSGQRHIPIASLHPDIARNSITLIAPTKTFNIAGLQCSIIIIPDPALRHKYQQARQGLVSWVNLIGLLAGEVAYREGQEWLEQLLAYLETNRDFLYDTVQRELPGVTMAKPEGTYLAWLDCREAGIQGSPYEFFLQQARVALGDGSTFGPGGEGFVRLTFGCPRSMLVESLERMKQALAKGAVHV
jgi:cystathionine beta-lyase